MSKDKINRTPSKGIIWVNSKGDIVAEKDAVWGEMWIDGNSHIFIPRKIKKQAEKKATQNGDK
jgi:hypothetical protein